MEKGCKSVAFPAVSTGIYGFPKNQAAVVTSQTVKAFLEEDDTVQKVVFVFFNNEDAEIFLAANVF